MSGVWEFDVNILGDRQVHRFSLQLNGSKVTGRGMFAAAVSGEIRNDTINLSVGDPGREIGSLTGSIAADLLKGEGTLYGGSVTWTARRPVTRPGTEPVLHEFTPREYHRVIGSSQPPALRIFPGDTVRTRTVDANGYDERSVRLAPGGDPLVGPFFIHGALVGDTLAVTIGRSGSPGTPLQVEQWWSAMR